MRLAAYALFTKGLENGVLSAPTTFVYLERPIEVNRRIVEFLRAG